MSRPLEAATKAAFSKPILPLAVILRLEIQDDPLYAWTGIGDLVFTAGQTGDPSLDGMTFKGTGDIVEISTVSEGVGGSDALEVAMPGVDIANPMMRQLIRDRRRWQFKRAVVWLMALDPDTDAIAGKPFRIKTGRIDAMPYSENGDGGVIKCVIEGQQAYGNQAINTRYSEQINLNPNDNSQTWVHALANQSAELGKSTASNPAVNAAIVGSTGNKGSSGSGGRGAFVNNTNEKVR